MMKKNILFTAAATVLCLASCSQDDFAPVQDSNENSNVTFTVSLNDKPATRAFGDGTSATILHYAVYDVTDAADGNKDAVLVGDKGYNVTFPENSLSTSISLDLATGRDYKVVFFASAMGKGTQNVYTFSAKDKTVEVNYAETEHNRQQDVDHDCFYNIIFISKNDLGKSHSVNLHRPVAQVNFATADIDTDAVKEVYKGDVRTTVTGKGYQILHLLDGSVSNEIEFTTRVAANPILPSHTVSPVDELTYLHCTYILVPKNERYLSNLTLNLYKGDDDDKATKVSELNVSNVPLQANYRTNIYGFLLTSKTEVEVSKDNDWFGSAYDKPVVWD